MIPESRARYGSHYLDTASFYLQITSYFLWDFPDSVPSPAAAGHSTRRKNSEITKILSIQERLWLRPERVKVCSVDVSPLLSTVEMRVIHHCNGLI